jgi:Protein of unknown function (DUF3300)
LHSGWNQFARKRIKWLTDHKEKNVRHSRNSQKSFFMLLALFLIAFVPSIVNAQAPPAQAPPSGQAPAGQAPPSYSPEELDKLVTRIALYPDPLLAQLLAAATYPDQIQDAAKWADQHHYLSGDELAHAITEDHLQWDASVQAMLPFPSVLDMMANDMNWTSELGNAFLAQQQDVMDAVQRDRKKARDYGYLRSNSQIIVSGGPYIAIDPVNPAFICVPAYDPLIVFAAPRPGFFIGGAIGFGYGVSLGFAFRPWGWGTSRFYWDRHDVFIGGAHWGRNWANRGSYVHPYAGFHRFDGPRGEERHELIGRSDREREAARSGHRHVEEHHRRGRGH